MWWTFCGKVSQPQNHEFRNYPEYFHLHMVHIVRKPVFGICNQVILKFNMHSKTCVKWQLSKIKQIGFQGQLLLNAGQKYCKMLQGAFCNTFHLHFRPSISYHSSLRSLFCLFLSGRFKQVLL